MPPSAAPEWLLTGWILEMTATSAPASKASMAARMPAHPAPTMRTSCFASTARDATPCASGVAAVENGSTPVRSGRGEDGLPAPEGGPAARKSEPRGAPAADGGDADGALDEVWKRQRADRGAGPLDALDVHRHGRSRPGPRAHRLARAGPGVGRPAGRLHRRPGHDPPRRLSGRAAGVSRPGSPF